MRLSCYTLDGRGVGGGVLMDLLTVGASSFGSVDLPAVVPLLIKLNAESKAWFCV